MLPSALAAACHAAMRLSHTFNAWFHYPLQERCSMPIRNSIMKRATCILLLALIVDFGNVLAQDFEQVQIQVEKISDSIYMLVGSGGNIAVSIGQDGTFIVDDQFAPLTEKIVSSIATLTENPVAFVINTHWHFDHTDGNENFGEAGAVIVSHKNSRSRMETDQIIELFDTHQKAYSHQGLPKITFDASVRFHLNEDTIDVLYLGKAHTDGDAIVYFRDSNVMHTGDIFVRYGLPFIDQPNGGSINGLINVVERIVELTDGNTIFIPGHGQLSKQSDVLKYLEMLTAIRDDVKALIEQGQDFEAIVDSNPTEGYPATGVSPEDFVRLVYDSLKEEN